MVAYPRWTLLVVLALGLSGCAISELLPDWRLDDPAGPEPMTYRSIVAMRLNEITGAPGGGGLEISSARKVDSLKGPAWMTCLKKHSAPLPRYYAVFIQRERIVASRLSVLIDQCELQGYAPFDFVAEAGATVR